jgi:hypothetical protein
LKPPRVRVLLGAYIGETPMASKAYNRSERKKARRWDMPPEGLWISPTGKMEPVNEHLLALAERPDIFGLSEQEVRGADEKALRKLGERLIMQGWTRYRYLNGKYLFEVDNVRNRIATIEKVLQAANAIPQEELVIAQFSPHQEFNCTVEDLYEGKLSERSIFQLAAKKATCTWAFSYGRKIGS